MTNNFQMINNNGAVFFRASEITAPHGFSTRLGGVSKIAHLSSMNLGAKLGDEIENVRENYRIILDSIGLVPDSLVYTNQIHSNTVLKVGKNDIGKAYDCDGFVTGEKDVSLCVRTADCVPILFSCEGICVGACHAGWRGTVLKIQQNTVSEMIKLGANLNSIKVAVGACIHKCCYTVGSDFKNSIKEALGVDFTRKHIIEQGNELKADLVGMNRELLCDIGINPNNIFILDRCTSCENDLFFSHRAQKGKRGVMGAFIALK